MTSPALETGHVELFRNFEDIEDLRGQPATNEALGTLHDLGFIVFDEMIILPGTISADGVDQIVGKISCGIIK